MKKIVIGIAAGRKYENYLRWITEVPNVEVIKLSHEAGNYQSISDCHGLLLTGGEDVHPALYKKSEFIEQYHLEDFNQHRDEFELQLLNYSQRNELPLLGICRGLQLTNVFMGGTLIPHIPSFGKPDHTKYEEGKDRYHKVEVVKNSFLETISGEKGEVNSAHHQSVDKVGKGLMINAFSEDGIVEGMERDYKNSNSFLLLVQWHPERMLDPNSTFSKNIRDSFIKSI
ncbi:MAG: gamma-glutamyl-gamma-aminobutyrate hydrolase family protein [Cyclobacteriaceae bacterium]|nr:gamma-glutamyl-gamma-aminobutyrate hydrolase family protein [Cyclobacteriaceae bacterium]